MTKELHVTRVNAKIDPDPLMDEEFFRVFADDPAAAIEWAFRDWRKKSPFYPAISDIRERVNEWTALKKELDEKKSRPSEADRAAGNVLDFADLRAKLSDIAKKQGRPMPKVEKMVKVIDHEFPPPQELEHRRQEQLSKLKTKFPT